MRTYWTVPALTAALALSACANDPYARTKAGTALGAVTGAVIGHQLDDDKGRYIGAAVGALAGGAVGNYMDRQQSAFNQALAEEQQRHNLEIQRLQDGSLKLEIPSEVSFDFNSAAIKPGFQPTLDKVAGLLQEYNRTVVQIVGHTDSTGSDAYNQQLSQQRADSVAQYLVSRGVAPQRVRAFGAGESQPRASNATEAGRQQNRRVDIVVQPVVEGQGQAVGGYQGQGGYQQSQGGYQGQPPRAYY
ncbi:MAG: OmpA family protein [Pseudomonadota bacterium]|nr:OmpA family protein [Pseudomonadota bacterium]